MDFSSFSNSSRVQNVVSSNGWTEELVNQLNSEIIILAFGILIGFIIAMTLKEKAVK